MANVSAIHFCQLRIESQFLLNDSIFCKNRNKLKYESWLCSEVEGVPVAGRGRDDVNAKSQKNEAQLKKYFNVKLPFEDFKF